MVAGIGPFATICYEPRQIRKEATVVADSGAEMWLMLAASCFDPEREVNSRSGLKGERCTLLP